MSLANDSLSQRILQDLNHIFKRDPQILEFDIIPIEDSVCNKSPVIHVEHRLGLESWCVRHLYQFSYKKFIDSRITNNRIGYDSINEWTRALLLINPDLTTAWSARKELVQKGYIKVLNELQFSEVLLTRKPKSGDNFSHREWLIKYLLKTEMPSEELITNELRVTLEASSRYNRNYHAWSHRIWIIKTLFNNSLEKLNCDLVVTKCWLESHVSDYSCFQFRQFVFTDIHKNLICSTNGSCGSEGLKQLHSVLWSEMELLNDLLTLYTDQESLYIHRRFLLVSSVHWFPNESKQIKDTEIAFIERQLSNSYSNSKSNHWHLDLIRKHINYLNRKLNWNFDTT